MQRTGTAVDGFHLAYERDGEGPPVLLLHGWPGASSDYREVAKRLDADVTRPDLRGFGESDRHERPPTEYAADGQAASVIGLIEELRLDRPVIAGYDIGSRIAQAIARDRPDLVRALVLSPPMPGVGERVLEPGPQAEFWYQHFHRLDLAERLVDGDPTAVRAYLAHFWRHWSGPAFELTDARLDHLAAVYGAPGAMAASVGWYRAGSGMVASSLAEGDAPTPITTPTIVLWQSDDPLFPRAWSDRLDRFFSDVELRPLDRVGHFTPLEAPAAFAQAIDEFVRRRSS
jgi:pimeloyl-ACP methyl ester carboxylesterase